MHMSFDTSIEPPPLLVAQHDIQQGRVNLHVTVVFDETQFAEFIQSSPFQAAVIGVAIIGESVSRDGTATAAFHRSEIRQFQRSTFAIALWSCQDPAIAPTASSHRQRKRVGFGARIINRFRRHKADHL